MSRKDKREILVEMRSRKKNKIMREKSRDKGEREERKRNIIIRELERRRVEKQERE